MPETDHCDARSLTRDVFYNGQLEFLQPRSGMRVSSDSLLLAAAIPAQANETVFEAGTGTGIVMLGVSVRVGYIHGTGLEIQTKLARIAQENARINGKEHFQFIVGDVASRPLDLEQKGLKPDRYDHSFANPPFYRKGHARHAPQRGRDTARSLGEEELESWVKCLCRYTKQGGTCTLVYPAERLDRLLGLMQKRFGRLRVLPLYSQLNKPAYRVLVQGVRGSRAELALLPALVLQDENGNYFPGVRKILNGGFLDLS